VRCPIRSILEDIAGASLFAEMKVITLMRYMRVPSLKIRLAKHCDLTGNDPRKLALHLLDACSIKGDVKEHFSPCTGGADIFRRPISFLHLPVRGAHDGKH
jgi:hypothetical protein